MRDFYTVRINFKGGLVSPTQLNTILQTANEFQVYKVRFGLRQQMIFNLPRNFVQSFEQKAKDLNLNFEIDHNTKPNIVSSYMVEEVFQSGNWLTEDIYKAVFDSFETDPLLKVNISDAQQSFSPLFSGHLNFVSSTSPNYWHLYLRVPQTNKVYQHSELIPSNSIAATCQKLEPLVLTNKEISPTVLFSKIAAQQPVIPEKPFDLPAFSLPYYEGFNRYGSKTWLGIYKRNELFGIDFLKEICELCQNSKIDEICITPWKSIIIKGIEDEFRIEWSNLLFRHNINVRHSANELNWQVEDDSESALNLKLELAKFCNELDLRTFGICFGIKTRPKTEVYASIMVRRRRSKILGFLPFTYIYDVSYTEDFNPNGRTKKFFVEGVSRIFLNEQLRRCVVQYNKLKAANLIQDAGMKDDHLEAPDQ